MKKTISIFLVFILILSSFAFSLTSSAESTFKAGDALYLDLTNWTSWLDSDPVFYANFTDADKPADSSIDIGTADKTKYDPKSGLELIEPNVYKYVLDVADAGKTIMRFWRGNATTLWNYSITISASDYASGKNTVVVTGKNGEGTLSTRTSYKYNLKPSLSISEEKLEVGDTASIALTCESPSTSVRLVYELYINDKKVGTSAYIFNAEEDGNYVVKGIVKAYDEGDDTLQGEAEVTKGITVGSSEISALKPNNIYIHGTSGKGNDSEAWLRWREVSGQKYFHLPSSLKGAKTLEFFNSFSNDASIKVGDTTTTLTAGSITPVSVNTSSFTITADNTYNCKVMTSSGEGAVFVNNIDTSTTDGRELWDYLTSSKSNYASCTAAVTQSNGSIILEDVKKMKGRGNTSWNNSGNPKYGWNLTFTSGIEVSGMQKCKKFSLIPNFQDASLCRNRYLYDLSDEVGMPYASDSRFIDFYVNGVYRGCYMMAQKVDVGKNTLIEDFDENEYLEYVAGNQTDFSFVLEIGSGADSDEASTRAKDGNTLIMKNPGLEPSDPNAQKVLEYVRTKYNSMSGALTNNTAMLPDYLDLESMAKIYIINEYGKNWDSGAASVFFTYKKDSDGKYKFFASPVWDYDNSFGNANGVDRDLERMGVNDYKLPTGWWATKKTGVSNNLYNAAGKNSQVLNQVYQVWFEKFVPAIDKFINKTSVSSGELWSQDVYYNYLVDQAPMNFTVSPMIVDSSWISNHSQLQTYNATYGTDKDGYINKVNYSQGSNKNYDQNSFKGEYDYMVDWANSRAAWLSQQWINAYNQIEHPEKPTEAPTEETFEPDPEPVIDYSKTIAAWQFDPTGKNAGDALDEYGSKNGYDATYGNGKLTASINGTDLRKIEWSDVEYGNHGLNIVPIIGAGSKNVWYANSTPYILLSDINATGYESLKFTMSMAGSNKAPANWKLQYSTDGKNFTDISGAKIKLSADNRKVLTAYLNGVAISDAVSGKSSLSLRLLCDGKETVNGGNVDDSPTSGEIAFNYIRVDATKSEEEIILGDVDLDGKIMITDATVVQKYCAKMLELSDRQKKAADVCHDQTITVVNATLIQKYVAKLIDEF